MKHEPATMKKKADLMLKRGTISEAQHKKLHAKADGEIAKQKAAKKAIPPAKAGDQLSATGDGGDAATDVETGSDTPTADDPSATTRKPGPAKVTRGEPADPDL
jgi:hypothetical protein